MNLAEKRIVVTGGAGFLGKRIVATLEAHGAYIVLVPNKRHYDLRTEPAIRRMLQEAKPDIIIHAAALVGGIGANQARPAEFFYDNALMGIQLLHQAWVHGVEKFVTVGTTCIYPKWVRAPFHESVLWDGYPEETNAPYALAKKMLLVQGQAYRQQYGFNAVYLIPTNLYGEGDNFSEASSHVIPALVRKYVEAVETGAPTVTVWGSGGATREFLHVKDCAEAVVRATERYDSADPLNIGSGVEINMRQLADKIARMTGFTGRTEWDLSKPDGQPIRALDSTKAQLALDWRAQMPFDDGLRRVIDAYRDSRESSDPENWSYDIVPL